MCIRDSSATKAESSANAAAAIQQNLTNSGITPGTKNGNGAMAIGAGSVANGDLSLIHI